MSAILAARLALIAYAAFSIGLVPALMLACLDVLGRLVLGLPVLWRDDGKA